MVDPPAVSQGPPVVGQPVGHVVDGDVGVQRVVVDRDLAVVEETLEKPGVKMSQMNEVGCQDALNCHLQLAGNALDALQPVGVS
jgi:hypothetical protein